VQFAQAMDAVRRGDLAETARLCWIYINSREHAPQEGEAGLADKVESARFYLAESLEHLGYVHAAIDWYLQIVTERRAPQLLPRALGALERLSRAHGYDEEEIAHEGILTVAEFEELPPLLTSFIQFRQAVDDLRRGYDTWGVSHLDRIHKDTPYLSMALYARAVWRIGKGDTDQALLDLTTIIDEPKAPADVRARALHTRARLYYDRGKWDDAYADLDRVDVRYESGAEVLLEKAWARYRTKDYKTALGLIHALGAPSYAGRFAPERFLLRSLIFSKYCHFRAAKRSIEMFRDRYQGELGALRAGTDPTAIELLREAAYERTATSGAGAVHQLMQQLAAEQVRIGQQGSWGSLKETASLNHALAALYDTKMRGARFREDRQLRGAVERVANDLLDANEQMNLLEYEVGLGIYRRIGREARIASQEATRPTRIPRVSDRVYFHFDGEYWSDELPDMQFFIEDRCVD
jgi:tetratricopeptide (TPR) repeat protein